MTQVSPSMKYAVAIAVGPVGGFISAGRRSRDLWYGSRLVAELTRRVALSLLGHEPKPDFWTPRKENLIRDENVTFGQSPLENFYFMGKHPHEGPVISNKIRAIVYATDDSGVRTMLEQAELDAWKWLGKQLGANSIWEGDGDKLGIDRDALKRQIEAIRSGDFMEFYAAFKRVGNGSEQDALTRAQELRDARKNSRVFVAPSWTQAGHVRSTIEPGRDSVLNHYDPRDHALDLAEAKLERQKKGIRSDERLDAIALLRRYAAMKEEEAGSANGNKVAPGNNLLPGLAFPPLSRVAADPWIEGIKGGPDECDLQAIRKILNDLEVNSKWSDALHLISSPCREPGPRLNKDEGRCGQRANGFFPYDGSVLFDGALEALRREVRRTDEAVRQPGSNSAHITSTTVSQNKWCFVFHRWQSVFVGQWGWESGFRERLASSAIWTARQKPEYRLSEQDRKGRNRCWLMAFDSWRESRGVCNLRVGQALGLDGWGQLEGGKAEHARR